MCDTSRRLDLKDTILDRQKRDIKRTSAHVGNEHVTLTSAFLIKPVRNSSGGGAILFKADEHQYETPGVDVNRFAEDEHQYDVNRSAVEEHRRRLLGLT